MLAKVKLAALPVDHEEPIDRRWRWIGEVTAWGVDSVLRSAAFPSCGLRVRELSYGF